MNNNNRLAISCGRTTLLILLLAMLVEPAFASSGGSLPWEGPLEQIQKSITGPVAVC